MKKATALLVVMVFITTSIMFGGCGKENSAVVSEANKESTAAASVSEPPKEPVKLSFLGEESYLAQFSYKDSEIIKELEKRTNVTLEMELIPPNEEMKVAQTRMAAGSDLPDIIQLPVNGNNEFIPLTQNGLVIPLNDLISKFAPNIKNVMDQYPLFKRDYTMPDGKIYSLTYISDDKGGLYVQDIIRTDWLSKVGITAIPSTVDEYYNALKTIREKDANGNGKKDEMWSGQGWQLSLTFPQAFGINVRSWWDYWSVDENGKVYCAWTTEKAKSMFQYLNKLYNEKLIDPEYSTINYDTYLARVKTNLVSATASYAWSVSQQLNEWSKEFNGNYQAIDTLRGSDGKQLAVQFNVPGPFNGYHWVITRDCKNQEAAIKFLDYIWSPEGRKLIQYGIEGTHYKLENGKPVSIMADYLKAHPEYKTEQDANAAVGFLPSCLPKISIYEAEESFAKWKVSGASFDSYKNGLQFLKLPYLAPVTTAEESEIEKQIGGDIWNYWHEMRDKFIMGKESTDNWDKFVAKMKELGLDKLQELEQRRYDRSK